MDDDRDAATGLPTWHPIVRGRESRDAARRAQALAAIRSLAVEARAKAALAAAEGAMEAVGVLREELAHEDERVRHAAAVALLRYVPTPPTESSSAEVQEGATTRLAEMPRHELVARARAIAAEIEAHGGDGEAEIDLRVEGDR